MNDAHISKTDYDLDIFCMVFLKLNDVTLASLVEVHL